MNRVLQDDPEAFDGWRKYGIANGEEILAHYISDRSAVLNATIGAKENTLEHPYYEFYSPRDYSTSVNVRTLESRMTS